MFHVAERALFLAQICKYRLANVFANSFDCPCRNESDHVALDRSRWKLPRRLLLGYALQLARVPSYPVPVVPVRESTARPEPGVCGCGRVFVESRAPLKISASEGAAFLFDLAVGFVAWACTCLTLCGAHRGLKSLLLQSSFDHCQRASGSFDNLWGLSMGSRGCAIPEPWPQPLVHTALEIETGLPEVQEILGAEEVTRDEMASGLQLQWAGQAEFPKEL